MSSSLERVTAALELREPDRVPTFDLMNEFSTDNEVLGKKPNPMGHIITNPSVGKVLDRLLPHVDTGIFLDSQLEGLANLGAAAAVEMGYDSAWIPYFPVLGNHEFYGNNQRALEFYFSRFPHLEKRRWYSFEWKNIGLILLDANFSDLNAEQKQEQELWYLSELEKFNRDERIDHILVFCHESPYTNSRVIGPSEKSKVYFAEPFLRFRKTSLFFSGHTHSYERFEIDGKFFIVSGGGGGPRHRLTMDPKERRYQDLYPGPGIRFFHFCEIEIGEGVLCFRVVRLEGDETFSVVDPLTIPKPMPSPEKTP